LSTTSPFGGSNPAKTPGSTTWSSDSSAWQRPVTHSKHDESGHSGTWLRLEILPLQLSLQQSARSFLQQRRWAPKLGRRLLYGQPGGFLQAWDRKPAQTLEGSRD
jgi:hypothetical protein